MAKFHYAYENTTDGKIISIADVKQRAEHYYCISCGNEMSAALGDKREHYFRHKGDGCGWETYLHELGKRYIKERFDTQEHFYISYNVYHYCGVADHCKLKRNHLGKIICIGEKSHTFDLKEFYDTCEVESTYKDLRTNRDYRADLKLTCKEHPDRKPVFIEIAVTHDCEKEKIDSGIRIIELKVKEEADLLKPFSESKDLRFYNFKKETKASINIDKFSITKDSNGILNAYIEEDVDCREKDVHQNNSIFEFVAPSYNPFSHTKLTFAELGLIKANVKDIPIKHCSICCHYNELHRTPLGRTKVCNLSDNEQYKLANVCENYYLDRRKWMSTLLYFNEMEYYTWCRSELG